MKRILNLILIFSLIISVSSAQIITNNALLSPPYENTNPSGQQVIGFFGDSILGTNGGSGTAPTPDPNTLYQWHNGAVVNITTDIFGANVGSMVPAFSNAYTRRTGKKVVAVNGIAPSSGYYKRALPPGNTNNWYTSGGTRYQQAINAMDSCLEFMKIKRPLAIFWCCGVNDANDAEPLDSIKKAMVSLFTRLTEKYPETPIFITQTAAYSVLTFSDDNLRLGTIRLNHKGIVDTTANVMFFAHLPAFAPAGMFVTSSAHLNQVGLDSLGAMANRVLMYENVTPKMARSIAAAQFDYATQTRLDSISSFTSTPTYDFADCYYALKNTTKNNTYVDWAFASLPTNGGFGFSANQYITTNPTGPQYFATGFRSYVFNNVSIGNYFQCAKINTNNTPAGTAASCSGGSTVVCEQTSGSVVNFRVNCGTNTSYTTDTKLSNNSSYAQGRFNSTQYLVKNGVSVRSASIAVTTVASVDQYVGARNSGAVSFVMDGSFEYFYVGAFPGTSNFLTTHQQLENINNGF